MHFELEDPAPHQVFFYDKAIEKYGEELDIDFTEDEDYGDGDLIPDGGRKYFFAWRTENGNLLYDTEVNGDAADTFYTSVEEAEDALERLADAYPEEQERYEKANLYKFKEMEGVEAFTEQAGLGQFETDGGYPVRQGYGGDFIGLAESADSVEW
jgi:hypothetical protein